jgi:hypothetical protein
MPISEVYDIVTSSTDAAMVALEALGTPTPAS